MSKPFVLSLLGAESTGKSQLSLALATALEAAGYSVQVVTEHLREWCELHRRVPLQSEQAAIARAQSDRIAAASHRGSDVVIADTTALMTAVYSDYVFGDGSLYALALAMQKTYHLTLLMGLDMPWVPDGLQREGPHVRDVVDGKLRQALQTTGIAAPTIYGLGTARLEAALAVVLQAITPQAYAQRSTWKHYCEYCGDGGCEKKMARFSRDAKKYDYNTSLA